MPIRRSQKKRSAEPQQKQNHRRPVIDPLVNPGSSAHRHQARSKTDQARPHHRMVTLAQSSPGDRSARAHQSKTATVMLGLGIFGPGIANGIVSGGPQLGAGAAVGTGVAAGGVVAAGVAGAGLGAGAARGVLAGAARGSASVVAATSNIVSPGRRAAGEAASNAGGAG